MVDDPPDLMDWSEPGAPRSRRFGDVYYSLEDGLAESRAVFLAGCGLPDAWHGRARFTVAELGFGTGLNIAALLHLWRDSGATGRLHVFSVEGFPVARDDAARALSAWPEIAEASRALLERWPAATPGFHRVDLPAWSATLDLAVGDAAWALEQWSGAADAWFLDGFSPALNPDMWSDAVLDGVAARSAPGARLGTFTVAGAVRRGLAERGFQVDKRPGHGRKRERLEGVLPGAALAHGGGRVAIIGAGIAGASLTRALRAQGVDPVIIADGRAMASGFPAALSTPRLDAGDEHLAGLFAQALERADHLYGRIEDAIVSRGVVRLEHGPRDAGRFDKVANQPIWAPGTMTRVNAENASAVVGEPVAADGLMMQGAMTVRPPAILAAWLAGACRFESRAAKLERERGLWRVLDDAGRALTEAETVILTAGWGAAALGAPGLQAVRGQASWAEVVAGLTVGAAWGGYAAPIDQGVLFGATHDRDDTDEALRDADDQRNLEVLKAMLPELAQRVAAARVRRHAAIRATTRDRLPIAGRLEDGLFILGGLGSRGFAAAPLLADHVASLITGSPSPLPRASAQRVAPDRDSLRKR
ncbi:tRNA (5-methylaminomethyl-2-thiouridine)(34)-methyltransferase MnmD [Brevundimonas sp.]|uniref:tRNA (5-methylaminomethyl-2-thiouridine)(34)-methyltransferase MnmD n=1 Tax=Brevundimonas sp. TaxID=1871086 RepID=UPI00391DF822